MAESSDSQTPVQDPAPATESASWAETMEKELASDPLLGSSTGQDSPATVDEEALLGLEADMDVDPPSEEQLQSDPKDQQDSTTVDGSETEGGEASSAVTSDTPVTGPEPTVKTEAQPVFVSSVQVKLETQAPGQVYGPTPQLPVGRSDSPIIEPFQPL